MSYQEKKNIVSLMSTIVIFGIYSLYVFQEFQERTMDTAETLKFWAAAILILIPVTIVAKIIIDIVFIIINRIATREVEPSFSDELDKLIALKAGRNSHYVFVLGFILAMGALVMDMSATAMFVILLFSGFLSEVVGLITQLYYYRRGF